MEHYNSAGHARTACNRRCLRTGDVRRTLVSARAATPAISRAGQYHIGLNVALFFITIVSLVVAVAAYQSAEESGREQQKELQKQYATLESSRRALESVVSVAQRQQAALDRAIQVSESHLKLAEKQRAEELERRGRRPKLDVSLGDITDRELRSGKRFNIAINEQREVTLGFVVTNVGNATVVRPVMLFRAIPESVRLHEEGHRGATRPHPNMLQFAGPRVMDLIPVQHNPHGYRIGVEVNAPKDVAVFDMEVSIHGENLPAEMFRIGFNLIPR